MKNIKLELCEYSKPFISRMYELNKTAKKYNCYTVDVSFIEKGLAFAKYYHQGQFRKSGEPYYSHPIAVASMVTDSIFRENAIIAALLHDTLEDTELTIGEIEIEFSPRIAQMVDRLTRKVDLLTGKKMSAGECLLKAHELGDNEVVTIKSFDRWHNIMTAGFMSSEKQKKIAIESIKYFTSLLINIGLLDLEIKFTSLCVKFLSDKNHIQSNMIFSYGEYSLPI
jgi:(p)ppGpp synthase/HD superfamily hydrolase